MLLEGQTEDGFAVDYGLLFYAGCPSDGGWIGAAFAALEGMAETDPRAQRAMVSLWYGELLFAHEKELGLDDDGAQCPADFPADRAGPWLAAELRRAWEGGVFSDMRTPWHPLEPVRTMLLKAMAWTTAPEAYAVLRDIARDPRVYSEGYHSLSMDFRRDAARSMLDWRMAKGMSEAEAVKAVEADLAGAPPVGGWQHPRYPKRR
ncbi:MAG: hypothetical protein OXU64_13395 [Gemmatimonadota bacterium]|nr:hypothetical protein [Gemmatimonadota bacterium]